MTCKICYGTLQCCIALAIVVKEYHLASHVNINLLLMQLQYNVHTEMDVQNPHPRYMVVQTLRTFYRGSVAQLVFVLPLLIILLSKL